LLIVGKRADAQRAEQDFFELLQEQSNMTSSSVWADVKKSISSDPRYDAVGSSTLRQELFDTYLKNLASSSAVSEREESERGG
jgi:transcription elongation regulator 1